MYYRDWLDDKVVVDTDWPLSLGWKLSFYSTNKHLVKKKFYISKKKLKRSEQTKGEHDQMEGQAQAWNHKRMRAIGIYYEGSSSVRFIELIAHEVSHIVDYILETAAIKTVDTELRAYLIDWIVGKIMMNTKLNFDMAKLNYNVKKNVIDFSKDTPLQKKWTKAYNKVKVELVKVLNLNHSGELYTIATAKQIRESGVKNLELFFTTKPIDSKKKKFW